MRNFFILFVFFYVIVKCVFSFNVEIGIRRVNNRENRPQVENQGFGDMDMLAHKMMKDFVNMKEEMLEEEKEDNLPNDQNLPIGTGSRNVNRQYISNNGVQQEVITSRGNGFQTIQITEVHVGHRDNNGNSIPTIIIGKPSNLKIRGQMASPFMMMQQMDEIFDSMFESLLASHQNHLFKNEEDSETKTEEESETETTEETTEVSEEDLKIDDESEEIKENIEVKDAVEEKVDLKIEEIKQDVKIEEIKAVPKNKAVPIINTESKVKTQSINKTQSRNKTQSNQQQANHELAISHNSSNIKNKGDRILTSKQKKKQIKDERKKLVFVKICKVVFYLIILISLFVLGKKLLQILGLIEQDKINYKEAITPEPAVDQPSVEMKQTNIKNE